MKVMIVGGQARDIGKTTLLCALIAALPEKAWTAVKITQVSKEEEAFYGSEPAVLEEGRPGEETDSARFLMAGAKRAIWFRTPAGRLEEHFPLLMGHISDSDGIAIESNAAVAAIRPDVYLMVLDPSNPEFKASAREQLQSADAFVLAGPGDESKLPAALPKGKPVFRLASRTRLTPELLAFVRSRL